MSSQITHARQRAKVVREFGLHGLAIIVTLVVLELILHALDVPYLRADDWGSLHYRYVELAYPRITVPDPTAPLITMLRDYVVQHGARLLVGVQEADPPLELFLQQQGIPYARFDGAEYYDSSRHWTPAGHALVAQRLAELFAAHDIATAAPPQPSAPR